MLIGQVKENQIIIDGLRINYKIAGSGPVVLILHGWGGSSDSWEEIQKILSQSGYKTVCPDLPGFGKSSLPNREWGIDDYSNHILKFTNTLGLNHFFLLAHSFGGRVAIGFVVQHPDKVKKLILCDSAGIKPKPGLKTKLIFCLAKIGNALFTPRYLARFKNKAQNLFYNILRIKDYSKARGVMRGTIKKILDRDLISDLSQIKVKTLIVWGSADKMVPLKYAFIFKKKIKNSVISIMPKIGHSPHLENPEELSRIILKFIK